MKGCSRTVDGEQKEPDAEVPVADVKKIGKGEFEPAPKVFDLLWPERGSLNTMLGLTSSS